MFARHYVSYCETCGETTPHEDHHIGRWISIALGLGGIMAVLLVAFLTSPLDALYWLALLVYGGTWFALDRHERHCDRRCTRCRFKLRAAEKRTKPNPRNSTIDLS
jgi:hypothetical protein